MSHTLITNAQVYRPFDLHDNKYYQVRIVDQRIVSIEENGYKGKNPEKSFNAKGRVLCPSFKDSHIHFLRYSLMKKERDLRKITTWKHLKEQLSDGAEEVALQQNNWLVGRGLMDNKFSDKDTLLTAEDLDSIDIDYPIFLLHQDGHECVLNTKALEIVRKDDLLEEGHDEFIEKDNNGNWTGRFKDTAVHFIKMHFRNKSTKEAKDAIIDGLPHLAEFGITHIDSDDLNYVGDYSKVWKAYSDLDKKGELTCSAYLHHYVFNIEDMKYYIDNYKFRTGDGEGNVRVGAFKIFVDGTYRLHTAALNLPYFDTGTTGTLIYNQKELNKMVSFAEKNNMQVTMHCIGDRAVETALKAIIQANKKEKNPMRHRIIHMQNTRPDLLKMLHTFRVPIETQPGFLQKEYPEYSQWLGEDRCQFVQVGKSLIENDVIFTASSDAPIGPLNPMEHIFSSVNRTDDNGNPEGGWQPQEKITIDQAFHSYCTSPCFLNHTEKSSGRLLPGFDADIILLEENPHEVESISLNKLKVDAVWHKGTQVFDRYDS
ncbi:amidohydrolase [Mangrovivirga cuniculi]|uniref:Amidohydrolase n=1 Tax=Mangrovivirga cuniculi TaxID=2715131 RepID=A0A4D7JUU0_9BACT|nr:amidohydrolase family protein [Mangrovivirga cuniculi]QCK14595.1 amidohydrolase [Mangrovivirga cuniculi]